MPTMQVNDAEFYYELHGKGQTVVLIAGYTCDHKVWLPVLDKLTRHFTLLLFDNRGVGKTKDDGRALTAEIMAADVIALSKALHLVKPHIVGHSMGGTIAQAIASQYSREIGKLILLNTVSKWRQAMLLGFRSLLRLREQNANIDILLEASMAWVFGEAFLQENKQVQAFKQACLENDSPQSLVDQQRQFKVLESFKGDKLLSSIKVPTLVGYGNQDIICLVEECQALANSIEGAVSISFTCGHAPSIELPDIAAEEIIKFLEN